jgi:hypothetical protein
MCDSRLFVPRYRLVAVPGIAVWRGLVVSRSFKERYDSRSFVEDSPHLDDGSQFGGGCGYIRIEGTL